MGARLAPCMPCSRHGPLDTLPLPSPRAASRLPSFIHFLFLSVCSRTRKFEDFGGYCTREEAAEEVMPTMMMAGLRRCEPARPRTPRHLPAALTTKNCARTAGRSCCSGGRLLFFKFFNSLNPVPRYAKRCRLRRGQGCSRATIVGHLDPGAVVTPA